jgi:hypothetical protein
MPPLLTNRSVSALEVALNSPKRHLMNADFKYLICNKMK